MTCHGALWQIMLCSNLHRFEQTLATILNLNGTIGFVQLRFLPPAKDPSRYDGSSVVLENPREGHLHASPHA